MDDSAYNAVILVVLYLIGAIINRVTRGKKDKAMQELAIRLSLEYVEGNMMRKPRLAGMYEDREVMIEDITRSGKGADKKLFFRVIMFTGVSLPDSIRIHNSRSFGPVTDLFEEIGEFFGIRDIPFDNSVFDDKFLVRGRNETIVKSVIDPAVQESLIGLSRVNLVAQSTEIIFEDEGMASENESRIRIILQLQENIASKVEEVAAIKGFDVESEESPADTFTPQTSPEPTHTLSDVAAVDGLMGRAIISLDPDIKPQRSDYYPQPASPDDVIIQLKREGYYTGE